jgi:hypothetical protein
MIQLTFDRIESQFGIGWMATTGFGSHYFIRTNRDNGKTIIRTLDNKDVFQNNIDEAKEWCVKDYNDRLDKATQKQLTIF